MPRRFTPSWSVEEQPVCFVVRDRGGQLHKGTAGYRRRFRHPDRGTRHRLLGLGRVFDAYDNRENSRNEKQKPHERLDWPDTIRVPTAKTSWPLLEYQILSI